MADSLTKYGVYIDDLSKIRVLEPEAASQTHKLREECQSFVSSKSRWFVVANFAGPAVTMLRSFSITEFEKNSDEFIGILDKLAKEVEREKMRTIGARNLLRSVAKQREAQKQQMQALILEKSVELERLRVQCDSLKKIELEQLETIEHLSAN